MNAHPGPLNVPTARELTAHQRRRAFRDKIAAQASALEAKKNLPSVSIEPEAVPAKTDPPRTGSFAELLALRQQAIETLEQLDRQIGQNKHASAHPPVFKIQEAVAKRYGFSRIDLCSARRQAALVRARRIAYYLAKDLTPFSLVAIGRFFGGRDHTTVLSGVRKVHRLCLVDAAIAAEVAALAKAITGADI